MLSEGDQMRYINVKYFVYAVLVIIYSGGSTLPFSVAKATEVLSATKPTELLIAGKDKDDFFGVWLSHTYTEAFSRLGIKFLYVEAPLKRVSKMTDSLQVDGDISRVVDYHDSHRNLVRVNESHHFLKFVAYTTDPTLKLTGWKSLENTPLRVEYIRGGARAESELTKLVMEKNLSMTSTYEQALKKLVSGRTDLFVNSESAILPFLNEGKYKETNIYVAGVLERVPMHMFLIKKHSQIASDLSRVLRDLKQEGLIEKYKIIARKTVVY
ncbi:type 2 periplasmic-binding domain-containing protein [Vibrio algarum]|uniref:Transporter substrate-binding domain-containing protein n=1 Tax=Vibrio algarum TaxID=3020714 RepID=A0ABT4YVF5_9VIBR|nr:transporter substrate-binding domain-containing protein [Vibrio sp. KJ40-1]MDB1125355.1 transporter substrate-binding domain-containing protein [Vibrio sp. KJ40-1]